MKAQSKLLSIAVIAAVSAGLATSSMAVEAKGQKEKCYGVAKKGKNDCGTPKHACAGQAKVDNDPQEWIFVPKGQCKKMGGKLKP